MKEKDLVPTSFQYPFTMMRRLNDEIERMFEDFNVRKPFALFTPELRKFDWAPAIEIVEKENKLFVRAELPGLSKEDVKIDLTEELLTLQGERKQEKVLTEREYLRTERFYGTFFRQIPLPEGVKIHEGKAVFEKGILEIEVPIEVKKPVAGRRLPIEEPKVKELVGA
jgi:HSP20 family protein